MTFITSCRNVSIECIALCLVLEGILYGLAKNIQLYCPYKFSKKKLYSIENLSLALFM